MEFQTQLSKAIAGGERQTEQKAQEEGKCG